MTKPQQITIQKGGPTLGTIRMVAATLRDAPEGMVTVAELKDLLPKKVNHNALLEILDHLQENHRIIISAKGIYYLHPPSEQLKEIMRNGYEMKIRNGKMEFFRVSPERFRKT